MPEDALDSPENIRACLSRILRSEQLIFFRLWGTKNLVLSVSYRSWHSAQKNLLPTVGGGGRSGGSGAALVPAPRVLEPAAHQHEPDEHLQCLVTLAQRTFKTSMAWIALIDGDREWYLAKTGIAYAQTHRDIAFGAHSILQSDSLWVDDATADERFKYNKLVHDEPLIRFYLSHPLTLVSDGQRYPIGCLVVADQEPRCKFSHPTANDPRLLQTLAAAVVRRIEMMPRMHWDSPSEDMTDPANRNAVLRHFMSVAGVDMNAHLTSELSRRLHPRVVPMGKYVCRKGDQDNSMYFVVSGRFPLCLHSCLLGSAFCSCWPLTRADHYFPQNIAHMNPCWC